MVPVQTSRMNMGAEQSFVTRTGLKKPAPKIGRANSDSRREQARRPAGQSAFATLRRDRSDGLWKFVSDHCRRSASPAAVVELTFGGKCVIRRIA